MNTVLSQECTRYNKLINMHSRRDPNPQSVAPCCSRAAAPLLRCCTGFGLLALRRVASRPDAGECRYRYNRSLSDLLKALKGLVVMSSDLEAMGSSLYSNQVPAIWTAVAYVTSSNLSTCVASLLTWRVSLQVPFAQAARHMGRGPDPADRLHPEVGRRRPARRVLDIWLLLPAGMFACIIDKATSPT